MRKASRFNNLSLNSYRQSSQNDKYTKRQKKSLILTNNPKNQNQTKHIDVIYYYIRELVEKKELLVKWVLSLKMLANSLIKALFARFFKKY